MNRRARFRMLGVIAVMAALALSASPVMAATHTAAASAYTCSGGEIPSGTYASLSVTGGCAVAAGAEITVLGSVSVAAGAALDAQSAPATISIARNVTGGAGSLVGLGCQPPEYTGNSPGVYIVRNTVARNLTCTALTPGVSGGFVPGSVNVVGRNATGQRAALV